MGEPINKPQPDAPAAPAANSPAPAATPADKPSLGATNGDVPSAGKLPPKPPAKAAPDKPSNEAIREIEAARNAAKTIIATHESNLRTAKRWAPIIRNEVVNPMTTRAFKSKSTELGLDPSFSFDLAIDAPGFKVLVAVIPRDNAMEFVQLPFDEALGYHMAILGLKSVEELLLRLNSKPWIVASIGLAWAAYNYTTLIIDMAERIIARNEALKAQRALAEKNAADNAAGNQPESTITPE